jgi:hypothetical protein
MMVKITAIIGAATQSNKHKNIARPIRLLLFGKANRRAVIDPRIAPVENPIRI